MAQLILVFEWDGQTVHKETKGFSGKSCVDKTKFIDEALGAVGERKLKAEYFNEEKESEQEKIRVNNGH